ncbi:MAG: TonB-dependent receptor domain-containing protein [Pseudomonadota bacterium]
MKQLALSTAVAAVLAPSFSFAADSLDDVIVTATRSAQTADETLVPVTIITREDVEQCAQQDALDALEALVPSLQITRQGGHGKSSGFFLRGSNSQNVLVLIDGQRVGSATLGTTALEQVPADMIERIEIVRGPRASLYGSEAVGGVIHIFTRMGKPGSAHAKIGVGSHDTRQASAGSTLGNAATRLSLNATHIHSDGIDARPETQPDRDGFEQTSGKIALDHRFSKDVDAGISAYRAEGRSDYDDRFSLPTDRFLVDQAQQALKAHVDARILPKWRSLLQLGQTQDSADSRGNPAASSDRDLFKTTRDQALWQNDVAIGSHSLLTVGVEWLRDKIDSSEDFVSTSRINKAAFTSLQTGIGAADLGFALRHDDNEAFGGHTTGSIDLGYAFNKQLKIVAGYGESFRAPTFNDLFFPATDFGAGNPDLQPETNRTVEIGLKGHHGVLNWETRVFRTESENKIVWKEVRQWFYTPVNVDAATITGAELEGRVRIARWSVGLSYTHLDHEDQAGNPLPNVASNLFKLDARTRTGAWSYGGSVLARDGADKCTPGVGFCSGDIRVPGHTLLNLYADYRISKQWTAGAELYNAIDRDYGTVVDYNMPGRTFMLTLRAEL